ncbi:hypothetical protein [Plantibacter sp. VKM Ac-2876]|uniref:hypothetical protein n=1 Tax=Plantibacter sp. VKM Ac-2876 TaxID=2783826 RepID=UPI00188B33EF|nr:hypothetical protein [Plantibacter sp. VKM Ac-2876]MBF4565419.1 hypothetical protein [Plantibacter sp. VKM Ac-2876]
MDFATPKSLWDAAQRLSTLLSERAEGLGGKLMVDSTMIQTTDGSFINGDSLLEAMEQVEADRLIARDVAVFRSVDTPPVKPLLHDYDLNLHAFPLSGVIRLDFKAPTKAEADGLQAWAQAELEITELITRTFDAVPEPPAVPDAPLEIEEVQQENVHGNSVEVSSTESSSLAADRFGGGSEKNYRRGTDLWAVLETLANLHTAAVREVAPHIEVTFRAADKHDTRIQRPSLAELRDAVAEHNMTTRWIGIHVKGNASSALTLTPDVDVQIMAHSFIKRITVGVKSNSNLVTKGLERLGEDYFKRRLPRLRDGESRFRRFVVHPATIAFGATTIGGLIVLGIAKLLGW